MNLTLTIHKDARAFLAQTEPAFLQEEVAYGPIYGVAVRLRDQPERFTEPPYLATVHTAERQLAAAALMTPPHSLLVYAAPGNDPTLAFQQIVTHLVAEGWRPPAVNGPVQLALRFAELWQAATGIPYTPGVAMRAFELRSVQPPSGVSGVMRQATRADVDQILVFAQAFVAEALPHDAPPQRETIERLVTDGSAYLWVDGTTVALAAKGRRTPHGISIGYVYTPPPLRGRGYADALVAGLSQRILDEGNAFATLFTDLANPTSNHIYQAIGYRPVCDYGEYRFSAIPM